VNQNTTTYTFVVHVNTDTYDHAVDVMNERFGPDEDYGFDYEVRWSPAGPRGSRRGT
jgi:hypothetical protein